MLRSFFSSYFDRSFVLISFYSALLTKAAFACTYCRGSITLIGISITLVLPLPPGMDSYG